MLRHGLAGCDALGFAGRLLYPLRIKRGDIPAAYPSKEATVFGRFKLTYAFGAASVGGAGASTAGGAGASTGSGAAAGAGVDPIGATDEETGQFPLAHPELIADPPQDEHPELIADPPHEEQPVVIADPPQDEQLEHVEIGAELPQDEQLEHVEIGAEQLEPQLV